MSWECPYQEGSEPYCTKLNKACDPVQKGCVLYGKVRRAHPLKSAEREQEPSTSKRENRGEF